MDEKYALRWIDLVVTTILDPAKTNISNIGSHELESFGSLMQQEITQNKTLLSEAAFRIFSKRKIQRMVGQYHRSLFLLLETAFERHPQIAATSEKATSLGKTAIEAINELLDFIEHRFGEYIDLDSWVPSAHLASVKDSIGERLKKLTPWLDAATAGTPLAAMIFGAFSTLTDQEDQKKRRATFREVLYKKELIDQIEKLASSLPQGEQSCQQLTQMLVFMNFNSRTFVDYYTSGIAARIRQMQSAAQKRGELLLAQKDFNQLHHQSELCLHTGYTDVRTAIGRWFDAELQYLEKQRQWEAAEPSGAIPDVASDQAKILCFLSIDQIALVLRALDSLRIIQARSMNSVFQQIVPHLSTPRKKDISWESMRAKAYQFEESDKQRVLEMLDLLTRWISEHDTH
ncbi:hypothetical protein LZD49_34540 [Dyadobacter sp. CY261]|uniref:hypothetical protein n=1 Tax=Dyadobacter sp. CY261 TaxID=2907203 RepID=UPI001F42FA7B|nr:hypothetical protein [Dyadobacter sp. CY261]MCF0075642.1 hypothetical protein [Dyadobacter sp. CY261]